MSVRIKLKGLDSISPQLDRLTKPLYAKYGFAQSRIITDWEMIVGKVLSTYSKPVKLIFKREQKSDGLLVVEVYNSSLATQMMFMEPVILEKIAIYFGYKAVSKMKIRHRPGILTVAALPVVRDKTIYSNDKLSALIKDIEDDLLRDSLRSLLETLSS